MSCDFEQAKVKINEIIMNDGKNNADKTKISESISSIIDNKIKSNISVSKKDTESKQYINHSGGAFGSDTYWGEIGKDYGVISNHYYTGTRDSKNAPNGNVEISNKDYLEGSKKVAQAAKNNWGYQYNSMKDERLIRNWSQVKYADAIFAIGKIIKTGDPIDSKGKDSRKALKSQVSGGTGYAVEMALIEGKPVYVFDQNRNSWYEAKNQKWVKIDTPKLTKNFAGIGTRELNENGKKAIRDIYENTFSNEKIKNKVEEKKVELKDGSNSLLVPADKPLYVSDLLNVEKNIENNKTASIKDELRILLDSYSGTKNTKIGGGYIENVQEKDGIKISSINEDIAKGKIEKGIEQSNTRDLLPTIDNRVLKGYETAYNKYFNEGNRTKAIGEKIANLIDILNSVKSDIYVAESLGLESNVDKEITKRGSTSKINNQDVKEDGEPVSIDIDIGNILNNLVSGIASENPQPGTYQQNLLKIASMALNNLIENKLDKNIKVRYHTLTEDKYTRGTYTFGEDVAEKVYITDGVAYTMNAGIIDIYYGEGYYNTDENGNRFRTDITLSSDTELIVHEIIHSMIEKAYDQDKDLNRALFRLKEQVMKKLDYTVLITKPINQSSNEEIQLAKDIFEHMDNPTEFLAYAATNENVFNAFKDMQINQELIGRFEAKSGQKVGKFKEILNKFIDAINKMYTSITTTESARKEFDRIYSSLLNINTRIEIGEIDIKMQKEFKPYEAFGISEKYKKTNDWMLKAEEGAFSKVKELWSADTVRNKAEATSRFIENIMSWRKIQWLRDSRLLSDTITDIVEDTTGEDAAWFYKAVRNIKGNRERDKLDFSAVMKKKIAKEFADFTQEEKDSVTFMLQGDWNAIGVDLDEYKNMLEDETIVRARIDELKKTIKIPEYINQSAFLGYYIVNGEAKGSAMLKNAHQIYYRFHLGKHNAPIENGLDPVNNIKMIDELASLYATLYTDKNIKSEIINAINRDSDVVKFASDTYYAYRKKETNGQLADFSIFMDKGYVRKSSEVDMKFDIIPESKIIKDSKFSFLNHKVIRKRDDIRQTMDESGLNYNNEDYYMVIEADTDPARTQGVLDDISIIDTGSEFTNYTAGKQLNFEQLQDVRDRRFKKDRTHLNNLIDDSIESLRARDNYSIAEFDISGHIKFYSSPISESDRKLYGRVINDISDVVGNTTSHISTKEKALMNNQSFIDLLLEDSKNNVGADGYVFLGAKTGIKELEEYWAMIPDYSRHHIMSSSPDKGIWVKRSRINNIVGYKDPSISNMKLFGLTLEDYPQWQKAIKIVEHTWKEISSAYKEIIVKLMPDVVIGNASSNMFVAMRHGIGAIEYAKAFKNAWVDLSEYMELNEQLIDLKIDKNVGKPGVQTKIKELEKRLERNGMHPLIKDGQFSMIFEDIDVDIMRKSTHLKDYILSKAEDKLGKKTAETLDEFRQNIYLTKDTRGHRAIEKLTLFNDIINKKIIMDKMMQDLKDVNFASDTARIAAEEDVINYLDQLFVNYSYLTNKYVKWASDLNLILFIKYFLRAGKASLNMMRRQPLASTIAESLDTFVWNFPDPVDQYMSPIDTMAQKIGLSPYEMILEIAFPNILNPLK